MDEAKAQGNGHDVAIDVTLAGESDLKRAHDRAYVLGLEARLRTMSQDLDAARAIMDRDRESVAHVYRILGEREGEISRLTRCLHRANSALSATEDKLAHALEAESPALVEIAAERARQVEVEGWSEEHDDRHHRGELAAAAACYAVPFSVFEKYDTPIGVTFREIWPFQKSWDKRTKHDRRRQLVIAGALIVAEIERLERAETNTESE